MAFLKNPKLGTLDSHLRDINFLNLTSDKTSITPKKMEFGIQSANKYMEEIRLLIVRLYRKSTVTSKDQYKMYIKFDFSKAK